MDVLVKSLLLGPHLDEVSGVTIELSKLWAVDFNINYDVVMAGVNFRNVRVHRMDLNNFINSHIGRDLVKVFLWVAWEVPRAQQDVWGGQLLEVTLIVDGGGLLIIVDGGGLSL